MLRNIFLRLILAVPILAACVAPEVVSTEPATDQVATIVAATMQALPSQTPEPTVGPACPEPGAGTQLLQNEEYGYCFLFPDGYERLDPLPYEVCLVPEGPSMQCHGANLIIEVHEASGRTVSQVADEKVAQHGFPETLERSNLTVSEQDAVLVDGLSGVAASRSVFIVHAGRLYDLMFIPWEQSDVDFESIENLYTTVIDSFTFVP